MEINCGKSFSFGKHMVGNLKKKNNTNSFLLRKNNNKICSTTLNLYLKYIFNDKRNKIILKSINNNLKNQNAHQFYS